jgi:hypothetical protein
MAGLHKYVWPGARVIDRFPGFRIATGLSIRLRSNTPPLFPGKCVWFLLRRMRSICAKRPGWGVDLAVNTPCFNPYMYALSPVTADNATLRPGHGVMYRQAMWGTGPIARAICIQVRGRAHTLHYRTGQLRPVTAVWGLVLTSAGGGTWRALVSHHTEYAI